MNGLLSYSHRLIIAVAFISAAIIAYQISIIQLLSFMQWHHFAFMVISIALLGFGAAGTTLTVFRAVILKNARMMIPLMMLISGIFMSLSVWLCNLEFARMDSMLLFTDPAQWLAFASDVLIFLLPFFTGALSLGIVFSIYVSEIGKFYFGNLIGSGFGAIAAAFISWKFTPAEMPVIVSLAAALAGCITIEKFKFRLIIPAALSILLPVILIPNPPEIILSQYKSISRTLNLPGSKIEFEKSSPYGFLQVVSADALRFAPALSLAFSGEAPSGKAVFNNGNRTGIIPKCQAGDSPPLYDFTTMALPYTIGKASRVLSLSSGTGAQVCYALLKGAVRIDAAESNSALINLSKNELAKENDSLFYRKEINVYESEPRTFLSLTSEKYDLIEMPVISSFGGTAGLFAMQEEYLLTLESFSKMYELLTPGGMICVTAWLDYPFRIPIKIAATFAQTAEKAGAVPVIERLAAVRSWGTVTFILKKSPITSIEIDSIKKFCEKNYFDPLLLPGIRMTDRMNFNAMNDTSFFYLIDAAVSASRESLFADYDFHIKPATDNKPYFSQFLRGKSIPRLAEVFGMQSMQFIELGYLISAFTFLFCLLLALILIIVPLFVHHAAGSFKFPVFFYFSGLGIGYMLFEIVLIQKFVLLFGNPVYAASFAIGVMLIFSGGGSYLSSSGIFAHLNSRQIFVIIIFCFLLYAIFLTPIFNAIIQLPLYLKAGVSVFLIAVPAFLMGIPFPRGLKKVSQMDEKNIPWAWGINGCMSVIGATGAALISAEMGFTMAMLIAALAYSVSMFSSKLLVSKI